MASTNKIERMGKGSGRKEMNVYKNIDGGKKGKPVRGRHTRQSEVEMKLEMAS